VRVRAWARARVHMRVGLTRAYERGSVWECVLPLACGCAKEGVRVRVSERQRAAARVRVRIGVMVTRVTRVRMAVGESECDECDCKRG